MSTQPRSLPLQGLRVVDLSEVWAGPMAASYLADWGAEVIRVESYPRSETLRPVIPTPGGLGFADNDPRHPLPWERHARRFISNHSKQGIALNLRDPRGLAIVQRLITISDVLIENYSSGTIARLGLPYETVREMNPRIIMASISGWGDSGPYAGHSAMGAYIDTTTGNASIRGYADEDDTRTNLGYQSDALAPLAAVLAISAALHERNRTGHGQRVELSMAEVLLTTLARPVADAALNGRRGTKLENDDLRLAPHGCYPCRGEDRWITIAVESEPQWCALCEVLGAVDLLADARLATEPGRWHARVEVNARLAALTVSWDNMALMEELQEAGVPAGAVYDEWDAMRDPHLRARDFWVEAYQAMVGERTYPRIPWRIHGIEPAPYRPANQLGEHNVQVLRDLLGLTPHEVARLAADSVIATSYR